MRPARRGCPWAASAAEHPARLGGVASQGQDDQGGAPPGGGGVDRADVGPLLGQPGREAGERAWLVPQPQRERRLLVGPVPGLAKGALGPSRIVDQQPDLPAAGTLGSADRRDVDSRVGEGAGHGGERAGSRGEAERELGRPGHRGSSLGFSASATGLFEVTTATLAHCAALVPSPHARYGWPGATTNVFGTSHPPGSVSASPGSFTVSCVDGPPSRLRASRHPSPPRSGGSARKRAKAVASTLVDTTSTTMLSPAHTAVRSAIWGFSGDTCPPTTRRGMPWTTRRCSSGSRMSAPSTILARVPSITSAPQARRLLATMTRPWSTARPIARPSVSKKLALTATTVG